MFAKYSEIWNGDLKGYGILNYLTSHDDGTPFDQKREKVYESANKLLLSPGTSQMYYGDETARPLLVEGAVGDANLRSLMNWEDVKTKAETKQILKHYQKLGQFRRHHPAVGAGIHKMISKAPYTFTRTFAKGDYSDEVVVALNLPKGEKVVPVIFANDTEVCDAYSGKLAKVKDGKVKINTEFDLLLLERKKC